MTQKYLTSYVNAPLANAAKKAKIHNTYELPYKSTYICKDRYFCDNL